MGILHRPLPDKGRCLGVRWHWGILLGTAVVHCCCLLDSPDNPAGRWVGNPGQGVRPVLAGSWVDSSGPAPSLGIRTGVLPDKVALCGSYLPARQLGIRAGLYCNIYIWHSDQLILPLQPRERSSRLSKPLRPLSLNSTGFWVASWVWLTWELATTRCLATLRKTLIRRKTDLPIRCYQAPYQGQCPSDKKPVHGKATLTRFHESSERICRFLCHSSGVQEQPLSIECYLVCLATWVLLWGPLPWVPSGIVVVRRREPAVPVLGAACEAVPRVLTVILKQG